MHRLTLLALILPFAVQAQAVPPGSTPPPTPAPPGRTQAQPTMRQQPSQNDTTFVRKASEDGAKEVAMGKIAVDNGQSRAVKQFGHQLVEDHSTANQKLSALASRKGLTPSPPKPDQGRTAQRFRAMHGANFDTAFASQMVADHEKAIHLFRDEAQNGRDPDLRAFARDTLPTLEDHLQRAKALAKPGGGMNAGGMPAQSGKH
jgi:putative membrane protein